jgi:transposase
MHSTNEIRVCMDIGSHHHRVGIGISNGPLLEEFDILHTPTGIDGLFEKIDSYQKRYDLPVSVAMEAYNGYARPIDQRVLEKGYRLFNVNNNKLAQYKNVFPGAAKTDAIDTQKMYELFTLSDHLPLAKKALQEVVKAPEVNEKLKRLTRRRRALVNEKVVIVNRLQSDLLACAPGLLDITKSVDNLWFLHFLTSRDDLRKLARMRKESLLDIKNVGKRFVEEILNWQKNTSFSDEIDYVNDMIIRDANRILELLKEISRLEKTIDAIALDSEIARRLRTISGFGEVCAAEIAGEIGTMSRFFNEGSLALYFGMAVLSNSSGTYVGSKQSIHVNRRAKLAMMTAVARHIHFCDESKIYYDRKRAEGKKHNQAVRSLGRHMVRVIWSMLRNGRDYVMKESEIAKS